MEEEVKEEMCVGKKVPKECEVGQDMVDINSTKMNKRFACIMQNNSIINRLPP